MSGGVKMTVTIPGLKKLGAVYQNAAAVQLPEAVREELREVAEETLAEAKAAAPKRTGALASSLKLRKSGPVGYSVGGSRSAYFNAVHWGTGPRTGLRGPHLITKKPFLFDLKDEAEAKGRAAAVRAIEKLVEEMS